MAYPPARTGGAAMKGWAAGSLLALLLAAVPQTARADVTCRYIDGTSDKGPCLELRNAIAWYKANESFSVWCQYGPTPRSRQIVLRRGDSFTCRGRSDNRTVAIVQRTQAGCQYCYFESSCAGKTVRTLRGGDGDTFPETCE